jgi:hypothetical protein
MTKLMRFVCVFGLIMGALSAGHAEKARRVATVSEVSGTVEAKIGKEGWAPAVTGMVLNQDDMIRTGSGSLAILNLDGMAETAVVEVKESSQMRLAELLEDRTEKYQTTLLDLALGEILIRAKKLHSEKSRFEVKTPTSIVAVRGTTFSVSVKAVEE